jgi:hypothetical protein
MQARRGRKSAKVPVFCGIPTPNYLRHGPDFGSSSLANVVLSLVTHGDSRGVVLSLVTHGDSRVETKRRV